MKIPKEMKIDKRTSLNFLNSDKIDLAEATVDSVFKERIRCTREEQVILLVKAYSNVANGCEIISIDKKVPKDEIDSYKQYDHKCRVVFKSPIGDIDCFYMSYQNSGKEATTYWKAKFLSCEDKRHKVIEEKKEMRLEIESLKLKNERMLKALEFYSHEKVIEGVSPQFSRFVFTNHRYDSDCAACNEEKKGSLARSILKDYKNESRATLPARR